MVNLPEWAAVSVDSDCCVVGANGAMVAATPNSVESVAAACHTCRNVNQATSAFPDWTSAHRPHCGARPGCTRST